MEASQTANAYWYFKDKEPNEWRKNNYKAWMDGCSNFQPWKTEQNWKRRKCFIAVWSTIYWPQQADALLIVIDRVLKITVKDSRGKYITEEIKEIEYFES